MAVGVGVNIAPVLEIGNIISQIINILWLLIIAWGVAKAFKRFLRYEYKILFHDGHTKKMMHVRRNLAIYLLLWLEFIVASDIIDTMLHLDMEKLLLLGGLIIIRIVVGYSLDKEIKDYEELKRLKEKEEDDDEDEGSNDKED